MSTDLIDSNLIIYAAQSEHDELRGYIADEAPFVSVMSKVETLGYHGLDTDEKAFLEDFFGAAAVLPVSQNVVEEAIRLRQKRNMSLGDALIAGTATSRELRVVTHNTGDFDWIDELEVFDPLERAV
ncbi:MAG: PIN domain nuclease [Bacteroidetes bacterium QH_8_67_23]|nr:MAG: PIN domain nuclease [Bacteroidetes bacterium QH_8_67_23]